MTGRGAGQRKSGRRGACLLLLCAGVAGAPLAGAADWSLRSSGRLGTGYESNFRLVADPESNTERALRLAAALRRQTERLSLELAPSVQLVRYSDSSFDRNDWSVDGILSAMLTELSVLEAAVGYDRGSSVISERGETGLTFADVPREERSGRLSLSRNATERDTIGSDINLTRTRYVDSRATGLVDYDYESMQVWWDTNLSARTTAGLRAGISRLQADSIGTDDRTRSLQLTGSYALSELTQLQLAAGRFFGESGSGSAEGGVYSLVVAHDRLTWAWDLSLARTIQPTGRGLLSLQDKGELTLRRRFSENASMKLRASTTRTRYGERDPRADLDYWIAAVSADRRLTRDLAVELEAGYEEQTFATSQATASSRFARLNLIWRPENDWLTGL